MKLIKRILEAMAKPFIAFSVIVDETRNANLDGRYDKYWERKNRRDAKRERRAKNERI